MDPDVRQDDGSPMPRNRPPHLKPRRARIAAAPADIDLFRRSVADAIPLPPENKAKLEKPRPKARTRSTEARAPATDDLTDRAFELKEPGEALAFSRAGLRRNALRALR